MQTPENLGPVITALNEIIHKWHALVMHEQYPLPSALADEVVNQYFATVQLRNKLLDAATSPD